MSDEFERIARLERRLSRARPDVLVGIGDDAAVLAPSSASTVVTVDAAVEGVHFRRALAGWEDIGYRAIAIAASDLAAMGARGRASVVALVLTADLDDGSFDRLADGIAQAADDAEAPVVGGNLSSGGELSITTTVLGSLQGEPLRRSGAQPGDGIYVTGYLGSGALGLQLLEAGHDEPADAQRQSFVRSWQRPTPQLLIGRRLVGTATAAIDVSDGLLQDLGHLCRASEVGAELHWELLPLAPGFDRLAQQVGADPVALALGGGDDYQLLFTAPASEASDTLGTRIGRITPPDEGLRVLDHDGHAFDLPARGFRHF